jgi:S-adenosylmethionine:tRNA ribosyltransferase-isomerase
MNISDFDYELPEGRIAKFPLEERDASRLLVWKGGDIAETTFGNIGSVLPAGSLLVFNNTRVVRARLVMHKPVADGAAGGGARIEILCLEPVAPADYERAFAARGRSEWSCMTGNLKKWKSGPLEIPFTHDGREHKLLAWRETESGGEQIVRFEWDGNLTFGQLLELLGRMPIPPYLNRDSAEVDNTRYQTVYARAEGSVAAPTAGLHFTPELISRLKTGGVQTDQVTLHVGAGTFLPVKVADALQHPMHTEHFEVTAATLEHLLQHAGRGPVIAVGTTSVRTLESLPALAWRIEKGDDPVLGEPVGQFELNSVPGEFGLAALRILLDWARSKGLDRITASTRIMISPGSNFRIVEGIVTNFHQPRSTLLLLIAAFTGGRYWRRIYDYALTHDFRFLSYGDSSLLFRR